MELPPEESFEYTNLDRQTRTIIWQYTAEIKDLMRLTAENIISIGQKLTQVKHRLGHGSFQQWLRSEFEWSEQTARQFMHVYRWSETIENKNFVFSKLGTSALYLLAAPSTPPEAREEVLDLVDGGENINYTRAKNIINRYREIPSSIDSGILSITGTEVESETKSGKDVCTLLFRLQTAELGCIVKLYHADELEAISDLSIDAIVKIKTGRLQGRTAKIIEILKEQQSLPVQSQDSKSYPTQSTSAVLNRKLDVYEIDKTVLSDRQKTDKMSQHLIISYGDSCLAVKGNSHLLTAFIEQVKSNADFVNDIFQQAYERFNY